jgi:hypothetical protein
MRDYIMFIKPHKISTTPISLGEGRDWTTPEVKDFQPPNSLSTGFLEVGPLAFGQTF